MKSKEISDSVRTLRAQGRSLHEISRLLRLSRNTVRRILREQAAPAATRPAQAALQQRLKDVYVRAQGNAVRMAQILAGEYDMQLPYSTLTRWVRQAELRAAPKRSGEYHFAPGQEMQHDTSPHRLMIGGKTLTAQCAALALAYSRRLFVRYYLRFTRLEAKHFLLQAAQFMDGGCPRCVIDNTSVMVVGGAGAEAVFAPEMEAFAATLGFKFMAHRVNDPNRKARIERPFYLRTDQLPARAQLRRSRRCERAGAALVRRGGQRQAQALAGQSTRGGIRHWSGHACASCRRCCRRSTRCSIGWWTCTASSAWTPTATRCPSAWWARR